VVEERVTISAANMLAEHDKPANMQKIIGFMEEAAEKEARLLVFPECSLQGFLWSWDRESHAYREDDEEKRYFYEVAEPIPGPFTQTVAKYAARCKMVIQVGMAERVDRKGGTVLYNSTAILGPEGLVGVFRKVHVPLGYLLLKGGKEFPVFNTFVGKIGPIICADLEYPESVRVLALKGAEIITMSTAWGMDPRTDFSGYKYDLLGRANALMNGVWMIMANQVGATKRSKGGFFGHSRIIDPKGNIIAGIGYEEGLVTATVNIKAGIGSSFRPHYFGPGAWEPRCPECYRIICARCNRDV